MVWRVFCFAAGLPVGALAAVALHALQGASGAPRPLALELGALAGGALLLAVTSIVARFRDDDHDRGLHLAASSATGFAALPALVAALAGLPPSAPVVLGAIAVVMGAALVRGAWRRGPAGGARRVASVAVASLLAAALGLVAFDVVRAGLADASPPPAPGQVAAILDLDARVPTRPLPRCAATPRTTAEVADRGAHPRPSADGASVWFDAATADGTRQVHRLALADGAVRCFTCGEPGNNVRPSPSDIGAGVLFDTDRWATVVEPLNTELQLIGAQDEAAGGGSRRLTVSPGPDDHALFGPGASLVVWSHGSGGRYGVVSGVLRSGHGGILLDAARVLHDGGSSWTAPLAWSPDARALVVVRGNPLRPLEARAVDPATGAEVVVGEDVPGSAPASFTPDGGWLALVTAERARVAGLLPARLGFLVAPFATRTHGAVAFRGTGVRAGEPSGPGAEVELGEDAAWGEPTGVALAPDGASFVLGQRRERDGKVEERLLRVVLDCAAPGGV